MVWAPLLTLKSWESWIKDEMTSKTRYITKAMHVHMPKFIIMQARVLNFQTYKLVFCMYNKLSLHAAILS